MPAHPGRAKGLETKAQPRGDQGAPPVPLCPLHNVGDVGKGAPSSGCPRGGAAAGLLRAHPWQTPCQEAAPRSWGHGSRELTPVRRVPRGSRAGTRCARAEQHPLPPSPGIPPRHPHTTKAKSPLDFLLNASKSRHGGAEPVQCTGQEVLHLQPVPEEQAGRAQAAASHPPRCLLGVWLVLSRPRAKKRQRRERKGRKKEEIQAWGTRHCSLPSYLHARWLRRIFPLQGGYSLLRRSAPGAPTHLTGCFASANPWA